MRRARRRRVLVTGAAGFIGTRLVRRLLERDCEVVVFDLSPMPEAYARTVSFLPVDVRDRKAVQLAVSTSAPDVVVHLASLHFIPHCIEHPAETWATNVRGTANLLEAVGRHEPVRFVLASTAAVYRAKQAPHREDDPLGPGDVYGRSKLRAERLVSRHAARGATRAAIARIFNVYGEGATIPHVIPAIVSQALTGSIVEVGNLTPRRDYVHVDDVATGLAALALDVDDNVTVNVGTGRSTSVAELVRLVSQLSGRPIEIVRDPARLRRVDRPQLQADVSRLAEVLAWTPTISLERGIESMITAARVTR